MPASSAGNHRPLSVYPYSIERLCELFARCAGTTPATIDGKLHRYYFEEYFEHLNAKTIVVEHSYTDRHFLEDYAGYYVRCFGKEHSKYKSRCWRLHFFHLTFDEDGFRRAVLGLPDALTEDQLNKAYLGFIVVKPLPKTFIGRTCLAVYRDDHRRHYPITHRQVAHLAGFRLKVESLAFQEQDKVAAACATSALWSLFQQTGMLFQHHVPSPLEITRTATQVRAPILGRDVPSAGLTVVQMAAAIKSVGLEPEIVNVQPRPLNEAETPSVPSPASLQAITYAYLKAGIPVMLVAALYDRSPPAIEEHNAPQFVAGHAVTLTGYRTGADRCIPSGEAGTLFTSSRIDRLYVHDDQVGPFARLTLDAPPLRFPGTDKDDIRFALGSSFRGKDGRSGSVVFAPETLILPLYHKVRIPADVIRQQVLLIDDGFETARQRNPGVLTERLEWDVFLTTENRFKEDLRADSSLLPDERYALLEEAFPRFIWRAIALHAGTRLLEILFDATDIEQGDYVLHHIVYDRERVNGLFA